MRPACVVCGFFGVVFGSGVFFMCFFFEYFGLFELLLLEVGFFFFCISDLSSCSFYKWGIFLGISSCILTFRVVVFISEAFFKCISLFLIILFASFFFFSFSFS